MTVRLHCRRIAQLGYASAGGVEGHATIVTNDPDLVVLAPGQAGDHPPRFATDKATDAFLKIVASEDRVAYIQRRMKCDWAETTAETTTTTTKKKKKKKKKGDKKRSEL